MIDETKGAIAVHHTAVDKDSAWDAGEAMKALGDSPTAAQLKALHAWYDSDGPADEKGSYKLPHHNVSDSEVGVANMKGCASAMGRLNGGGLDIPDGDRKGVHAHLAAHYKDADMECPDLKSAAMAIKSRLRMEIKEITAEGSFEGILSPYGNVDGDCDVVDPGAYTKTLKENGPEVPLMWNHGKRVDFPIGKLVLEDRENGLWCKGQILIDSIPVARTVYSLIKLRIVKGLSIGYKSIKDAIEGGVRHLKEIKLYEGSIVTFPMNEMALITAVKARETKDDFNEELAKIQTLQGLSQMLYALQNAIYSVVYSQDLGRDEKISAMGIILEQFTEAMSAFFPQYLDAFDEVNGETWARGDLETKVGAMISAENEKKIRSACTKIREGYDELMALLENDKAGMTTLSTKAAQGKTEPVENHSAADDEIKAAAEMISQIEALIPR